MFIEIIMSRVTENRVNIGPNATLIDLLAESLRLDCKHDS